MKEYLINVGDFNIIVLPHRRQYFIVGEGNQAAEVEGRFIRGEDIAYDSMQPLWFNYQSDETWKDFDQKTYRLGRNISEDELVDMYVLKKFNFGSLVAVRDADEGRGRVFKRDMLKVRN